MSTPGYGCEFCNGQHPVNWLITHLNPAATISTCDEDFPVAMLSMIAGELGVEPGRMYDVVKRFVDREAAKEAKEAKQAADLPKCPDHPEAVCFDPPDCAEKGRCLKFTTDPGPHGDHIRQDES